MEGMERHLHQRHLEAPLSRGSIEATDAQSHAQAQTQTGQHAQAGRSGKSTTGSLEATSSKLDAALESIVKVRNRQSQQLASAASGVTNGGVGDGRSSSSLHGVSAAMAGAWPVTRKSSVASSTSSRLPAAADPDFVAPQDRGSMLSDAGGNTVPNGRVVMARTKSRQGLANDAASTMPPPASLPPSNHVAATAAAASQGEATRTSADWSERGASRHMEHVIVNGMAQSRIVKKGVRDFSFGRTLGEGSYSTVVAATDKQTLKEYAIKVLDKRHIIKEKKVKYVNIEKDTLFRLQDHPGIVRLYYTFQDEASLYFVLDLAPNGELLGILKRLGSFNVECTRYYGAQILDAIGYMHTQGVIHRDLKPENVLLDQHMRVKIADFGTAKLLSLPGGPAPAGEAVGTTDQHGNPDGPEMSDRSNSFVGTAEYVSPELLTEKSTCKASDLWAFGCIVFQMLAGRPPFKAGNEYQIFQKIIHLDYSYPPGFPPDAQELVTLLLVRETNDRLTLQGAKQHAFFHTIDWTTLWQVKAPQLRAYKPPPMVLDARSEPSTPAQLPPQATSLVDQDESIDTTSQSSPASSLTEQPRGDEFTRESPVGMRSHPANHALRPSTQRTALSAQSNASSAPSGMDDRDRDRERHSIKPASDFANHVTHQSASLPSTGAALSGQLPPPTTLDRMLARVIDLHRERVTLIDRVQVLSSTSDGPPPRRFNRLLHRRKWRHLLVTTLGRCLLLELSTGAEAAIQSATSTSLREGPASDKTTQGHRVTQQVQQIAATVKADIDLSAIDTTIRPSTSSSSAASTTAQASSAAAAGASASPAMAAARLAASTAATGTPSSGHVGVSSGPGPGAGASEGSVSVSASGSGNDGKSFILETSTKSWLCTCRDARRAGEWRRHLADARDRASTRQLAPGHPRGPTKQHQQQQSQQHQRQDGRQDGRHRS